MAEREPIGATVVIEEHWRQRATAGMKWTQAYPIRGDEREFDEKATETRIDIFLESLGLKKP